MASRKSREERIRTVDELAESAFEDHVLLPEGEGRWFCGRPGTGMYHFRIVMSPGCILLYGDIGEAVFRCHERDALAWLLASMGGGRDYILGKCPQAVENKDRSGWASQSLWHHRALKRFCELLNG
jgi:hypothetical protein